MKLDKILNGIEYNGKFSNKDIKSITYNSKKIINGSLFIAIKGEKHDGHDYINEAVRNGASAIVANGCAPKSCDIPIIKVKNTRKTMSKLAANFYNHPSEKLNTIGITGTNGKTTTCFIINKIFNAFGLNTGSIGTLGFTSSSKIINTGFTTPESLELHNFLDNLVKGGIMNVVMEVSSHALALHRMDDVDINTAIFTNLTSEHLDFHGNMDTYFSEKMKLFKGLNATDIAIINIDDKYAKKMINQCNSEILTFGFNKSAYIYPISYHYDYDKMSIEFSINKKKYKIKSKLTGFHNVYNIMASILASIINKIPIENIIEIIEKIDSIPGRMEFIGNKNKRVFIDYAHTPNAFENILSMVNKIKRKDEKMITLFGCGGDRDKSKREKMTSISEKFSDLVIITTDNPRNESIDLIINDMIKGFSKNNYKVIIDRTEAIEYAMEKLDQNSILLILGKGRENYQIIGDVKKKHNDVNIIKRIINES